MQLLTFSLNGAVVLFMIAVCLAGIMYSDPFPVYNYMQCVIEYIGNRCMRII